jgi:hypothetical protein
MARTLQEIQEEMKAQWMAQPSLRELYGFTGEESFDTLFPAVSIERMLVFIFSTGSWILESIWDRRRGELEALMREQQVLTLPWYYAKVKEYRSGRTLVWNPVTFGWQYADGDAADEIVKFVAVRNVEMEGGATALRVLVSGTGKVPLTADLDAITAYIKKVGGAGIHYEVVSAAPDALGFTIDVYYDPTLMRESGALISDPERTPVEDAIRAYLDGIEYGGVFYATKLVDAIQEVEGVLDVELKGITVNGEAPEDGMRRIESVSGSFTVSEGGFANVNYLVDEP